MPDAAVAPPLAPAPTAPPVGIRTRQDLLELARARRPWSFVPLACKALALAPADHALRLALAGNLAALGLRTFAARELSQLPPTAADHPDVRALHAALAKLTDNLLPTDQLVAAARAAINMLVARHIDTPGGWDAALAAWSATLPARAAFRASDGNVIWCPRAPDSTLAPLSAAQHFDDLRSLSRQTAAELLTPAPDSLAPPLVIEGLNPPWFALAAAGIFATNRLGYRPRFTLLQLDPAEFFDAVSTVDCAALLADPRCTVIIGRDAAARFAADLAARPEVSVSGPCITIPPTRARLQPSPAALIDTAVRAQLAAADALRPRVEASAAQRDRWPSATPSTPLNVLLLSSRHSTFIQHAARDLAAAFAAAGHHPHVLMEPDPFSLLNANALLNAADRSTPDLVIAINYPRARLGPNIPASIPHVCWVQDALPFLFDAATARALTPRDFVVGHVHMDMFDSLGYPLDRFEPLPVVACPRKFHAGPISAAEQARFACDLAVVTHHSETPEQMHARLTGQATGDPRAVAALTRIYAALPDIIDRAMSTAPIGAVRTLVKDELLAVGGPDAVRVLFHTVLVQYAQPMLDRLLRHQALQWAAELADEHHWSFAIFGKGWDSHPTLARFARGPLDHGPELRACYQAARAHLHVSSNVVLHQRVIECALSGGLPLSRLTLESTNVLSIRAAMAASAHAPDVTPADMPTGPDAPPTNSFPEPWIGYSVAQVPELRAWRDQRAAIGCPTSNVYWTIASKQANLRRHQRLNPARMDPITLLGPLQQTGFWSKQTLATRLQQVISSDARRSELSSQMAAQARANYTTDAAVAIILSLVRSHLSAS